MKHFRNIGLSFIATLAIWSCDKTATEIDYSGRYQGDVIETEYYLDADSNLIGTSNTLNEFQMIVEKGRSGYYVMQNGVITYFTDGRGESSSDPSVMDNYVRTYFELKNDSLLGTTDQWWTNNGELGWWITSSKIDSINYRHSEFRLKAL